MELIRSWHSGQRYFTHYTSGSTGRPKKIVIGRDKIEISAKSTLSAIDPNRKIKNALLCLNPLNIGGAMVVYRSLLYNLDLTIIEPSTTIMDAMDKDLIYDLTSMVPMQYRGLSKNDLTRFRNILIGGAPMAVEKRVLNSNIYSTYGMTETVSHIALRKLSEEAFTTIGDTVVDISEKKTLKIKGSITDNQWLETNDIVDIQSDRTFKWLGRVDFVINSGGIKINPEMIEAQLEDQIKQEFIATSLPDDTLGRRLVLLIEGDNQMLDFSTLEKYHQPKEVFFNQKIFKTANNKIDRKKTQEHFESTL
ncbi:AMP-binding protein [Ekhidna sp.]|uniref:AMP-binding protein n=1 Tax=Ekhidna sp. TaxID=2608089 RepID=UPI003C7CF223